MTSRACVPSQPVETPQPFDRIDDPADRVGREEGAPFGGLDALLQVSARACPDAILLRDADGGVTAREVAARVSALAAHLGQCGVRPGERILLVMGAATRSLIALIAALRAGLEPALVPCGLGPVDLATRARIASASVLAGPTRYGALDLGDTYLSAAALTDTVRLVATLGPGATDGAADFSPAGLDRLSAAPAVAPGPEAPVILTFESPAGESPAGTPTLVPHRQAALFAEALALVDQAGINPSRAMFSTIAPATLAGLVAGPFAALTGASSLTLHGPFDAAGFIAARDADPGAHLVVPAAIAPMLREAGLLAADAALVLLSRFASPEAFAPPPPLAGGGAMVDLHAFGETAVLAARRVDGAPRLPDLGAESDRRRAAG